MAYLFSLYDSYQKSIFATSPDSTAVPNSLKLYSCGPTVYGYQHIGNMRAAWLADSVAKMAKMAGWSVEFALNITDVGHLVGDGDGGANVIDAEDKMEKGARKEGKTVREIVDFYTIDYFAQTRALSLDLPTGKYNPKATQFILEQMLLAVNLLVVNRAYLLNDGIYFDSEANFDLTVPFKTIASDGNAGFTGRDIKNTVKSSADFALWKFIDSTALQKWQMKNYPQIVTIVQNWADARKDDVDFSQKFETFIDSRTPDEIDPQDWCVQCLVKNITSKWGCPGWHSECVAMICGVLGDNSVSGSELEQLKNAIALIDSPSLM